MKTFYIFTSSEYICYFCGGAIDPYSFCGKCWDYQDGKQ
jgi:hypothetical protein